MTNMPSRPERYVNMAEAKARLFELVEKAASGEEIVIARDHKPEPLRIHVARFNPALRLYQRLGFTPIAGRGVDLFMEWRARD